MRAFFEEGGAARIQIEIDPRLFSEDPEEEQESGPGKSLPHEDLPLFAIPGKYTPVGGPSHPGGGSH